MKTLKTFENGETLEINYANAMSAGSGHKRIEVELYYQGEYKKFDRVTSDMPGYDEAQDIEDMEEKYEAYYNLIAYRIDDEVNDWIEKIDN